MSTEQEIQSDKAPPSVRTDSKKAALKKSPPPPKFTYDPDDGVDNVGPGMEARQAERPTSTEAPVSPVSTPPAAVTIAEEILPVASQPAVLSAPVVAHASSAHGRVLRMINVDSIDENPYAPREIYTPEVISARGMALLSQGQHDPIHVIPNPDALGRFIIADGWTRVLGSRHGGVIKQLLAQIHDDLTVEQAAWYGYEQNEERSEMCDYDRGLFYHKLIKEGLATQQEIAKRLNRDKSTITQYVAYGDLPEEVREIVKTNIARFPYRVAYALKRLADSAGVTAAVKVANEHADNQDSRDDLINKVQAIIAPIKRRRATRDVERKPREVRDFRNGRYLATQDGKFELSIKIDDERREEFRAKFEALIAAYADTSSDVQESMDLPVGSEDASKG